MEISFYSLFLLSTIGLIAGISAGFIGIGGGVIMVPVLLEIFRAWGVPHESLVQAAMGTSLTVATFSVASSAFRHQRQGNVLWRVVPFVAPSSMAGGWLATLIARHTEGTVLQVGLALVLALAAVKMLLERKTADCPERRISLWGWALIGFGVGLFAGLTGLAGGLVFIPAMAFIVHIPTRKLAGTSSGVVMFTALASAVGYMVQQPAVPLGLGFVGHSNILAAFALVVTAVPGAQLGAKLNRKAGTTLYKRIFAVLLILVVTRLLMTA